MRGTGVLELAGGGRPADQAINLAWLRVYMLLHVAVRTLFDLRLAIHELPPAYLAVSIGLVACCLAGFVPRLRRPASVAVGALLGLRIALTFPLTGNHIFLEFVVLFFLALLDESSGEKETSLLIQALRSMTVIFFFYTGFQKVVYGRYFDGQFLAFVTATDERFATVFRHLMPIDEFERLRSLRFWPGQGPFRVDSPLFVLASNLVWIFELTAPVAMLVRATRIPATVATIAFIVMVELGARELLFGGLMLNLLLLFLPGVWIRRLFPPIAVLYAYLAAHAFDLVPAPFFHF